MLLMRLLIEGGLYSRAASIQGNTVCHVYIIKKFKITKYVDNQQAIYKTRSIQRPSFSIKIFRMLVVLCHAQYIHRTRIDTFLITKVFSLVYLKERNKPKSKNTWRFCFRNSCYTLTSVVLVLQIFL